MDFKHNNIFDHSSDDAGRSNILLDFTERRRLMTPQEIRAIPDWTEVRVKWQDAYCPASGWHDTQDYEPRNSEATTLGRIWHDCQEGYLTVVGTIFEAEMPTPECVGDINHIPITWVLDIEILPNSQTHN
jgi:hypothetical protein